MGLFEYLELWKKENPEKSEYICEILKINEELDKLEERPVPLVEEVIWTDGTRRTLAKPRDLHIKSPV